MPGHNSLTSLNHPCFIVFILLKRNIVIKVIAESMHVQITLIPKLNISLIRVSTGKCIQYNLQKSLIQIKDFVFVFQKKITKYLYLHTSYNVIGTI